MPGRAVNIEAMPTANETAPPGLPATSTPTVAESSAILSGGKPIAASASAERVVLMAK